MNKISEYISMQDLAAKALASVIDQPKNAGSIFIGTIVDVLTSFAGFGGIVIQHAGRGDFVFHLTENLDVVPAVGAIAAIKYDEDGNGMVVSQHFAAA